MRKNTDQERARRDKLASLRREQIDPFPARIGTSIQDIKSIRDRFSGFEKTGDEIAVAGRIRAIRLQGQSTFLDCDDGTGKLQCFFAADSVPDAYDRMVNVLDLGDIIVAIGTAFTTKRGEPTLKAREVRLLAKSLKPLPDKRHGLADIEIRYRHRELDLIANPDVRKIFETRSTIISAIREFLDRNKFIEVDTPVLQKIPGGATARPFKTHHNALDIDLYLRVAPELYLKRLIIGGFRRVYEIARCFRNEGIDFSHNPEFTQVELYAAYMDYTEMMSMTESMLSRVVSKIYPDLTVPAGGSTIPFKPPYPRMTFRDAIKRYASLDIGTFDDHDSLYKKAKSMKLDVSPKDHRGKILDELFKTFVRPKIVNPTFIIDHPVELSPLAKKKTDDPHYVERFQLLVAGSELCNAFSELNDPDDQRERFAEQERLRREGDDEAQRVDDDFLNALEYGMPPTAGLGLGIDRLVMILTDNHAIKEVIAFPTLKPKA